MANLATRAAVEGNPLAIHAPVVRMTKAQMILAGIDDPRYLQHA